MSERKDLAITSDPVPWRTWVVVLFAALGSHVAWALHLNLTYFLVQPVCVMGGELLLHASGVISLLIVLASLGTSCWLLVRNRATFRENVEGFDGWKAFIGLFGVANAVIFGLAIIAQWSTVFAVDPCLISP